ncbi:hypothetical protein [Limnoglobus roseus]|uniref:Uncharacterized protein n=1 Tax=Limnoglobus roseus TaxID=2598579 RepID=A0A5C1AML2_9BACT|nr:hypothetical protein [Limnoglobus roseus]QEL19343.1 hypothetical protein PX52LOC_06412 [Limnoglobus roseus]
MAIAYNYGLLQAIAPESANDQIGAVEQSALRQTQNQLAQQQAQAAAIQNQFAPQLNQVKLKGEQDALESAQAAKLGSLLQSIDAIPDPDRRQTMYSSMLPVFKKVAPAFELPDEYNPDITGVVAGSAIDPKTRMEQQIGLQKAQLLAGTKTNQVTSDADGSKFIVNKVTGEITPFSGSPTPESGGVFPAADGGTPQPPAFGFSPVGLDPMARKKQMDTDAKRLQAYQNNKQKAENALRALDTMEPNLDNFRTGSGGDFRMNLDKAADAFLPGDGFKASADAANNIDKSSNDLVTELQGFQYVPGQRGSVLGLRTLLASKPGVGQQVETNKNIVGGLRSKLNNYLLSEELAQQYKEANPFKLIDSNAEKLDDALKALYPLETIDQKSGKVTFHPESVERIRAAIPDAIANPQKYLQAVQQQGNTGAGPSQPVTAPKVGTVEDGHVFLGGDPADPNSWKAQ